MKTMEVMLEDGVIERREVVGEHAIQCHHCHSGVIDRIDIIRRPRPKIHPGEEIFYSLFSPPMINRSCR
jgi:hypothetical protein